MYNLQWHWKKQSGLPVLSWHRQGSEKFLAPIVKEAENKNALMWHHREEVI
jgi:hypothetical protein